MAQKKSTQKPRSNKPNQQLFVRHIFGVRLAHHHHTGKVLHWHHTSYAGLFFIIATVSLLILFTTRAVVAYEQTGTGGVQLSGVSKGPPPETAAVITSPTDRRVFEEGTVSVEGTCERGLFIELYRNSVLAGGGVCAPNDTFKVLITIVPGKNDIQARIYDALKQYGPDSKLVTVWYNVPLPPVPSVLVYAQPIQKGHFLGDKLLLEYVVSGGDEPYALSIDWGDNTPATVLVHKKAAGYKTEHEYKKDGQYTITISVTDERGQKALIQSIAIVHSSTSGGPLITRTICEDESTCLSTTGSGIVGALDWAWPAVSVASMMTLSFFIGEKVALAHSLVRPRMRHGL